MCNCRKQCRGLWQPKLRLSERGEPRWFTPRVKPRQAEKLAEAAKVISSQPSALQLRYLQTLSGIATERSNVILFPLPMDITGSPFGQGYWVREK